MSFGRRPGEDGNLRMSGSTINNTTAEIHCPPYFLETPSHVCLIYIITASLTTDFCSILARRQGPWNNIGGCNLAVANQSWISGAVDYQKYYTKKEYFQVTIKSLMYRVVAGS